MTIQKKSFFMIAALFAAGSSLKASTAAVIASAHAAAAAAHGVCGATVSVPEEFDKAVTQTKDLVTSVEASFDKPTVGTAQSLLRQVGHVLEVSVSPLILSTPGLELVPVQKCVKELVAVDASRAIAGASNAQAAMCIAAKAAKAVYLLAIACTHEFQEALATTPNTRQANASAVQACNTAIRVLHKSVMKHANGTSGSGLMRPISA